MATRSPVDVLVEYMDVNRLPPFPEEVVSALRVYCETHVAWSFTVANYGWRGRNVSTTLAREGYVQIIVADGVPAAPLAEGITYYFDGCALYTHKGGARIDFTTTGTGRQFLKPVDGP